MDNARPLRLTAAAGTNLPSCNIAGSSFRSLPKIPHCWPLLKPGPCLSPSVVVQSLKTTKDHRLGKPLPSQLPNPA
eukprot:2-Eustigmatos_ZCMA.PRE.2